MDLGDTSQVIRLWALGAVWAYGPWVVLAAALAGGALLFQWLDRLAVSVQRQPITDGWQGLGGIIRNRLAMAATIHTMKIATVGGIALAGTLILSLQGRVAEELHREPVVPPPAGPPLGKEMSLDFILLSGVVVLATTIAGAILGYQALRRRAAELAKHQPPSGARTPLVVRLFLRPRLSAILLVVLGGYLAFGLAMQIFYLLVLVLPLPRPLLTVTVPGITMLAIGALVMLWLGLVFVMAAPVTRLWWRSLELWRRELAENRIVAASFKLTVAGLVAWLGFFLDATVLEALGTIFFPEWFP